MRKIATLIIICILTGYAAFAQSTGKISGTIKDDAGKGLTSTTVSLLKAKDSSLVKLAVTDKEGHYDFINIKEGKYLVSATSVGYGKKLSAPFNLASEDVSVSPIALVQTSNNLGKVTVTTTKPFIETKIDRTVVNVDASPSSAGSTALEVLEKSPGISVNSMVL